MATGGALLDDRRLRRLKSVIEGSPLAGCTGYAEIVATMVARRHALGLSQDMVDDLAGFAERHTAKLENWRSRTGRGAGPRTMARWIGALWPANDGERV